MAFDPFSNLSTKALALLFQESNGVLLPLYDLIRGVRNSQDQDHAYYWTHGVGGAALEAGHQAIMGWISVPQDDRQQVIRQVQRAYYAVARLTSVLAMMRHQWPGWAEAEYAGGEAFLAMTKRRYGERRLAVFFRYAADLLFDTAKHPMLGSNWMACTASDHMMANPMLYVGQACSMPNCPGTLRLMTWADIFAPEVPA